MADFEKHLSEFEKRDALVVAASVETEEQALETRADNGVTYPMSYGLATMPFAQTYGAYYHPKGTYLHATGFFITPKDTIEMAVYSSGAIGRLTASDCIQVLDFLQDGES